MILSFPWSSIKDNTGLFSTSYSATSFLTCAGVLNFLLFNKSHRPLSAHCIKYSMHSAVLSLYLIFGSYPGVSTVKFPLKGTISILLSIAPVLSFILGISLALNICVAYGVKLIAGLPLSSALITSPVIIFFNNDVSSIYSLEISSPIFASLPNVMIGANRCLKSFTSTEQKLSFPSIHSIICKYVLFPLCLSPFKIAHFPPPIVADLYRQAPATSSSK